MLEHGGDEDQAIAALLHDAVEDQGGDTTRQEIRERFGDRVAAMVDDCTDADVQPKPEWKERRSSNASTSTLKEVAWYYRSLVEAFEARQFENDAGALLNELKLAVNELEQCVRGS